jgi:hypothetical protein
MLSNWLLGENYLQSSLVTGGDFSLELALVDGAPFSLLGRPQVENRFGGDLIGWKYRFLPGDGCGRMEAPWWLLFACVGDPLGLVNSPLSNSTLGGQQNVL